MSYSWLKQYPDWVPPIPEVPAHGLGRFLVDTAANHPDYAATTLNGVDITYGQLNQKVNGLAHGLAALGVGRGDRVALVLPNSPTYVIGFYALMKLGAVAVNINVGLRGEELAACLKGSGAGIVISLDIFLDPVLAAARNSGVSFILIHSVFGAEKKINRVSGDPELLIVNDLISAQPDLEPEVEIDPQAPAVLQYTSGTSGRPKAAVLTQAGLVANVVQMNSWVRHATDPGNAALICIIPFFHVFGMAAGMNLSVKRGFRMILVPMFHAMDALAIFDLVKSYRPLSLPLVPALWAALVSSPQVDKHLLAAIEVPSSGGAPLPEWVQERFRELTGRRIIQAYGLSEASSVTHMAPHPAGGPAGSVGLPLPGTVARIVDPASGEEKAAGEIGELVIKGPQVMKEYWRDPDLTEKTLREGWLHTGDIARMDEQGFFYLVDRKDDLIIVSGFNVYPSEVEAVLLRHPAVKDVAVVGVPAGTRGETVAAFVVAQGEETTKAELVAFCREHLPDFKLPRLVTFLPEIPRNPAGKILHRVLRERALKDRT